MKISSTRKTFVTLAIIAITAGAASATSSSFTPTDDAMIFDDGSGNGSSNANGRGPGMFAGADGGTRKKRSLVKFDISSIATTATVTAVQLDLIIGQIAGSGGMGPGCGMACSPSSRTFEIYQIDYTNAWNEGQTGATACSGSLCASIGGTGQGWNYSSCNCGDVTWEYYDYSSGTGSSWGHGATNQDYGTGSFGSPTYGNLTAAGSWTFNNFLNNATMSFTGNTTTDHPNFTAIVQDWVTNPSHNNGFMIRGPALESIATSFIGWWTKDGALANSNNLLNPVLTVWY
jgi:hypothetical protein